MDETKIGKDSVLKAGVFKTEPSDGLLVQRLIMQRSRLRELLTNEKIQFVVMEAPILMDWSTELLYALNQFMHEVFLELGIFVLYIQSASWKKISFPDMDPKDVTKNHSTHLAKTELDRHGKRFSEHVADAYHLGKIGHAFYRWYFMHVVKDDQLSPALWELFCGKHTFSRGVKKGITEYYGLIYRENDQFFDFSKQKNKPADIINRIAEEMKDGGEGKQGKQGYYNTCRIL